MASAFDAYANAFASPYRESMLADAEEVELWADGREVATMPAIVFEAKQEEPELQELAHGAKERTSRLVRDVEFQANVIGAIGVTPAIGMKVVIDGVPWSVRRVTSDTKTATRVEVMRKVPHVKMHSPHGGGA
jgi:hypothetical protein